MRIFNLFLFSVALFLLASAGPVLALDETSGSLGFIPADANVVIALDVDELNAYGGSVTDTWRDADVSHVVEGVESLSLMMTRDANRPDVLTFFSALSGVQAFSLTPGEMPLMVFSASGPLNGKLLSNYTLAYIVERRYQDAIDSVTNALSAYQSEGRPGGETEEGEPIMNNYYPVSLQDLIDEGYLDSMPINPYTGRPMRIVPFDTGESLGNIAYETRTGYCDYSLKTWHIGGVVIKHWWPVEFTPYDNFEGRLRNFDRTHDISAMGFTVETAGAWKFFTRDDSDYAFASGEKWLVFGKTLDEVKAAVECHNSGEGFRFSPPSGFDTEGAFYRDQADLTHMMDMIKMKGEEIPPEYLGMITNLMNGAGLDALKKQHTAMWLRNGEIEAVRRTELTGEARGSLIGTMVYSEPMPVMTAENGPFDIIGEAAWAHPGDYMQAVLDYVLEFALPAFAPQMGDSGMDPGAIIGMLGLGENKINTLADQAYVLITSSTKRENGEYLPGITVAVRSDNPDLPFIATGIADTITLMVPELPLSSQDFGDENARTWVLDNPDFPVTPTFAWTDGWMVKSLWREDALMARDALKNGELLSPDGLDPANFRLSVHRRELLRGIADVMFEMPGGYTAMAGVPLEIAAQLSGENEALNMEMVNGDDYMESHCRFSLGLFENLVPVFGYVMKGMSWYW